MTTFIRCSSFVVEMIETSLTEFGLTPIEGRIYVALLKLGSTTTGPVVKKTELHRATVYDGLKRLMEKGLSTYIIKQKTKHFQAARPECLLETLEAKKRELEEKQKNAAGLIRQLKAFEQSALHKESSRIVQGVRGIKSVFEEILQHHQYCALASRGSFGELLGPYFLYFQKQKKSKNIQARILLDSSLKGSKYAHSIHGRKRFLKQSITPPVATFLYGETVASIVFAETPHAFVIESKAVAASYQEYFDMLWRTGVS